MKQLVLSGNRVLAHGEDCFLSSIGGVVFCKDTGRYFANATVANVTGETPSDIDSVGYEYHAGKFVPCAPFGKGGGNIAVVCNEDCKSIKDSGVSSANIGKMAVIDYTGTGTNTVSITAPFAPYFAVAWKEPSGDFEASVYTCIITPNGGLASYLYQSGSTGTPTDAVTGRLTTSIEGHTLTWKAQRSSADAPSYACNVKNQSYKVAIFGREE